MVLSMTFFVLRLCTSPGSRFHGAGAEGRTPLGVSRRVGDEERESVLFDERIASRMQLDARPAAVHLLLERLNAEQHEAEARIDQPAAHK